MGHKDLKEFARYCQQSQDSNVGAGFRVHGLNHHIQYL